MDQSAALISTLKRCLKMRGLTYRDIAGGLGISEASVKRLFSTQNISLERLSKICELANLNLIELFKQLDSDLHCLDELTEEQETELAADSGLLLITFLIINNLTFENIMQYYNFTEHELIRYLARLDRIKLIDLLPNNRFTLLISPDFSWRKNGPIQQFFTRNLQMDFLNSHFNREDETLLFLSGTLTKTSGSYLQRKLEEIAKEFNELNRQDIKRPLKDRWLTSMILAIRPWSPGAFEHFRAE